MDVVQRAKAMVVSPAAEWRAIEAESGDAPYLFVNYAAILAAIPPVCVFLRHELFGWRVPRFGFHHLHHVGFFSGVFGALVHYLAVLATVYAMARIVDALAPTFLARQNRESAMKLVVYSATPVWLAGVFALIPGLGFVRFIALIYSVYVFWLGLPVLMKPPPDRVGPYTAAAVVCAVVLAIVVAAIVGSIL